MDQSIKENDIVVIREGEDWPEHLFKVDEVFDDCVTGYSITAPLNGVYGEPALDLILKVYPV